MIKKECERPKEFALKVIDACNYAVLSMIDPEGKPYGVALNVVREGDFIYFHCAKIGKKKDCLRANPYGSLFCASTVQNVPEGFTTYFDSAIVAGPLEEITDDEEKIRILRLLCERYALSHMENFDDTIRMFLKATAIWKMSIDEITGKSTVPEEK